VRGGEVVVHAGKETWLDNRANNTSPTFERRRCLVVLSHVRLAFGGQMSRHVCHMTRYLWYIGVVGR
jgi:predicted glutamine amidotransferase